MLLLYSMFSSGLKVESVFVGVGILIGNVQLYCMEIRMDECIKASKHQSIVIIHHPLCIVSLFLKNIEIATISKKIFWIGLELPRAPQYLSILNTFFYVRSDRRTACSCSFRQRTKVPRLGTQNVHVDWI